MQHGVAGHGRLRPCCSVTACFCTRHCSLCTSLGASAGLRGRQTRCDGCNASSLAPRPCVPFGSVAMQCNLDLVAVEPYQLRWLWFWGLPGQPWPTPGSFAGTSPRCCAVVSVSVAVGGGRTTPWAGPPRPQMQLYCSRLRARPARLPFSQHCARVESPSPRLPACLLASWRSSVLVPAGLAPSPRPLPALALVGSGQREASRPVASFSLNREPKDHCSLTLTSRSVPPPAARRPPAAHHPIDRRGDGGTDRADGLTDTPTVRPLFSVAGWACIGTACTARRPASLSPCRSLSLAPRGVCDTFRHIRSCSDARVHHPAAHCPWSDLLPPPLWLRRSARQFHFTSSHEGIRKAPRSLTARTLSTSATTAQNARTCAAQATLPLLQYARLLHCPTCFASPRLTMTELTRKRSYSASSWCVSRPGP